MSEYETSFRLVIGVVSLLDVMNLNVYCTMDFDHFSMDFDIFDLLIDIFYQKSDP